MILNIFMLSYYMTTASCHAEVFLPKISSTLGFLEKRLRVRVERA